MTFVATTVWSSKAFITVGIWKFVNPVHKLELMIAIGIICFPNFIQVGKEGGDQKIFFSIISDSTHFYQNKTDLDVPSVWLQ